MEGNDILNNMHVLSIFLLYYMYEFIFVVDAEKLQRGSVQ